MLYQIVPPGMMISSAVNCQSRPLNFALTAQASADLKGSTFQLLYLILCVIGLGAGFEHIWELPVLRYHSIRGNYHYPFWGVIVLVILHDFIRQNYHKNQSDPYPFSLIMVNHPIFSFKLPQFIFSDVLSIFIFLQKHPNNVSKQI